MDLIPSRLGSSPVLDVAVEYIVNGFMAYQNTSFTTQKSALVSRGRASKALRMALQKCNKVPSYDVLLASKLLSYAEVSMQTAILFDCRGLIILDFCERWKFWFRRSPSWLVAVT